MSMTKRHPYTQKITHTGTERVPQPDPHPNLDPKTRSPQRDAHHPPPP